MARTSRKAAIREMKAPKIQPERIYNTAVYVRLSVENNGYAADRESIAMQQYMLEKYVEAQPDMRPAGVFCDNGETGTDFERPGFERMMDEVKSRRVDCIVVKDLSRFGRNYVETGYYLEKIFPYLGVRFIAVNDHYDTLDDKDGSALAVSLKNLVNDLYAKDISRKITSSLATKQKNGEFIGAFAPYGYLKSSEDRHKLVPDPETAGTVRDIFLWRLDGLAYMQIARRLNDQGVPSPAMYRYLTGRKKEKPSGRGAIWQPQTVRRLTENMVYAGHVAQGKMKKSLSDGMPSRNVPREEWIVVENTHEAVVSQETYDKVQDIADARRREYNARNGKYGTTENIFKGFLICKDCGTKMQRYKNTDSTGKTSYSFGCRVYTENRGGQGCTLKRVREPELKESVFQALRVQIGLALELEGLLEGLQKQPEFKERRRALSGKINGLRQKSKRNAALRGSLFEAYCDHTLTEAEYLSMKAGYDREAEVLKGQIAALEKEEQELASSLSPQNQWINALKRYQDEKTINREMALELIKCIKVSGYDEIEIVWNFQDEFARLAGETGKAVG